MTKLGVAASVALVATAASAETGGPIGLSARLGAFFPTGTVGENLGHTWFGAGLDYKLSAVPVTPPTQAAGLPSYLSISADYYVKDSSHTIPVAVNYNIRVKDYTFFAGIGAEDAVESGGSATIGLSGQFGASYDIKSFSLPVFLQAKYFVSGKDEFRGVGVYVGARF